MVGFLSLLNGLLDQSGTETNYGAATRPFKQPASAAPPQAANRKEKGERIGNTTEARPQTPLFRPIDPGAVAETPVLIHGYEITPGFPGNGPPVLSNGETQGSSALTKTQPLALPNIGAMNTASGASNMDYCPPSPPRDIAFALRLTWQPSDPAPAAHSQSDILLPGASDPRNPIEVASQTSPQAGPSEGASPTGSANTVKTEIPTPDPVLGQSPSLRGNDPLAHSICSLVPSISPRSTGPDSFFSGVAGFPSSETLEQIRHGSINASPAFLDQEPTSEAATNSAEIDPQRQGFAGDPMSVAGKAPAPSPPGGCSPIDYNQDARSLETDVWAEASLPPSPSPEQARAPESATSRRSPAPPLGSIASTQGTAANYSGNVMDRDSANSESDGKTPRIPITEKASQTHISDHSLGQAAAGTWLDRVVQPGEAMQTQAQSQTKTSTLDTPHAPTDAAESEINSTIQPQPIRQISFRLAAASASVDVQVAQRAGKVQVAVRTADPGLAQSLQTNLGELVGHLQDKGFKTETWTPITVQHGSDAVREPSSSANSQSHPDNSNSRGGQEGQQQGQQESNQRQQGRWKTQLEQTLSVLNATSPEEEKQ